MDNIEEVSTSNIEQRKPKRKKKSPIERIIEYLLNNENLNEEDIDNLGIKKWNWRILGDIVITPPFNFEAISDLSSIDRAFKSVFKKVKCVIAYVDTIKGELRRPNIKVLSNDKSDTVTVHIENGIKYQIDVSKVMFAAGNGTERMRFSRINAENETVLDMFAGIGYFTLPLAKHGKLDKLISIEKNPDSANLLRQNTKLNKVDDKVIILEGDNRILGDEWIGKCDRVLMGYLPSAEEFIPRALQFSKHEKSIIHYHYIAKKDESKSIPISHMNKYLDDRKIKILHIENVKSYAPQLYHYVADIEIYK